MSTDYDHRAARRVVYTLFEPSMLTVTTSNAGPVDDFVDHLQAKLDN